METTVLTQETIDVSERINVPDVFCPGCAAETKMSATTYAFYNGPLRCWNCAALFRVHTGEIESDGWFANGGMGGLLIEPPELLEPGRDIPDPFLRAMRSTAIPEEAKRRLATAERLYRSGEFGSVAAECRAAIEDVFEDYGIKKGPVAKMIEDARDMRLVKGFMLECCRVVSTAAGAAGHSSAGPKTQWEALVIIGAAVAVLGRIYALPQE